MTSKDEFNPCSGEVLDITKRGYNIMKKDIKKIKQIGMLWVSDFICSIQL